MDMAVMREIIEKFDSNEKIEISDEFDFFKCFSEYIDKGKLTKTPNTINIIT